MVRLIRKESKKLYRKEDNFYSSNLGVDDIEDIIASGLDWTSDEFEGIDDSELMSKKEYDDASKLITIEEAEAIIGKRPDATKPKPPTSANPRPSTIQKYLDDVKNYKDKYKALIAWEKKFDRLVALKQQLKDIHDKFDAITEDLQNWCAHNDGIFLVRKSLNQYGRISDPISALIDMFDDSGVPKEIYSLEGNNWGFDNADIDEDTDPFPSVLITVGKKTLRIISISEDLNTISDILEKQNYVKNLQPKDILSKTNTKLDTTTQNTLKEWNKENVTNSSLDADSKELRLYLISVCFMTEIKQLNKWPSVSTTGDLVSYYLKQV